MHLTPATIRVWNAIADYITAHGYAPTHHEIEESLGIKPTPNTLVRIAALENAGILERIPGRGLREKRWRGIRLLQYPPREGE